MTLRANCKQHISAFINRTAWALMPKISQFWIYDRKRVIHLVRIHVRISLARYIPTGIPTGANFEYPFSASCYLCATQHLDQLTRSCNAIVELPLLNSLVIFTFSSEPAFWSCFEIHQESITRPSRRGLFPSYDQAPYVVEMLYASMSSSAAWAAVLQSFWIIILHEFVE